MVKTAWMELYLHSTIWYGNNEIVDSRSSTSVTSEAINGYNAKLVPNTLNPHNLCPYKPLQSHLPVSFLSSKWMALKKRPHQNSKQSLPS
jgi:hypothetical protein